MISLLALFSRLSGVVRRIIGVPDYEAYLAHQHACHVSDAPLTREAFVRESLTRRYERPGSRCC